MFNLPNNAKYIGTFAEERNGEKHLIEKWEVDKGTPQEHNAKIETAKVKLEASKVDEKIAIGESVSDVAVK